MSWCPNCGHKVPIPLPVEPLYDSDTAALLVPTTRGSLFALLSSLSSALRDSPQVE